MYPSRIRNEHMCGTNNIPNKWSMVKDETKKVDEVQNMQDKCRISTENARFLEIRCRFCTSLRENGRFPPNQVQVLHFVAESMKMGWSPQLDEYNCNSTHCAIASKSLSLCNKWPWDWIVMAAIKQSLVFLTVKPLLRHARCSIAARCFLLVHIDDRPESLAKFLWE